MPIRRNEVKAAMHSVIYYIAAIQSTLVPKKALKLIINILNN